MKNALSPRIVVATVGGVRNGERSVVRGSSTGIMKKMMNLFRDR